MTTAITDKETRRLPRTTFKTRKDGYVEIANPRLEHVKPGMMVRANWRGCNNWGVIIREINVRTGKVLIGNNVGGTRERWEWVPVVRLRCVWSIGTYDEAMGRLRKFSEAMQWLSEQDVNRMTMH